MFDPDQQRITHAAITENKHLGAALAYAKALQASELPPAPKIGKQRTRYQPTGRKPPAACRCRPDRSPSAQQP